MLNIGDKIGKDVVTKIDRGGLLDMVQINDVPQWHIAASLKKRLTKRAPDRAKSAVKKSSSTTRRNSARRGR